MSQKIDKKPEKSRLGTVGGQAVMEGVMMKSEKNIAIAVRRESGELVTKKKEFKSIRSKYKIFNIPILRGFINFIDMMILSMSTLNESMEMLGLEEQMNDNANSKKSKENNENKEENKEQSGEKEGTPWLLIASILGIVFGLALSFALFFFLPTFVGKQIAKVVEIGWFLNLIEGVLKLVIFVIYISLVSLMKDIRRTFEYHGAEHMAVFCYEKGDELTVENVKKHSRFHPRCGTSFMIVMMIVGIGISSVIPLEFGVLLRVLVKLSLFPLVIGLGFEFIKFAGKNDNILVKIVSAPGLWVQRLSTKQPDDSQIQVAIESLKLAVAIENQAVGGNTQTEKDIDNITDEKLPLHQE